MDKHIADIATVDGDLVICRKAGVADQRDMTITAEYDRGYFEKYTGYEGSEIAERINRGRIEIVAKHAGPVTPTVDIGIGSGEFLRKRGNTWGRDVNLYAERWLRDRGLWADDLSKFRSFTFWDVIEHVQTPEEYFRFIGVGAYLFTSVPIMADLSKVRESKHYRPGEHLYYWTHDGFVSWMMLHGFEPLEVQSFEMDAGRDSIYTFAFKRVNSGG